MDGAAIPITTWVSTAAIAVSAIVGLLNLIVTSLLTLAVHRFGRSSSELQILQRNSQQWQELNIAMLKRPHLQLLLDAPDRDLLVQDAALQRNIIFYVLNIVHDVFHAQQRGMIDSEKATPIIEGQLRVLQKHAQTVESLLMIDRGFDRSFAKYARDILREPAKDSAPDSMSNGIPTP